MPSWIQTLVAVCAVLAGAIVGTWVLRRGINRFVHRRASEGARTPSEAGLRGQTVAGVLCTVASVLLWAIAILVALGQSGINTGPLLASVGIAGAAIGIGGQHFVRDLIEGVAIVLEDQYRVGDVVEVQGTSGRVERVSLRSTAIRDVHGKLHIFANGDIRHSANLTKGFSRYVIDLPLPYGEDIDRATQIARRVLEQMRREDRYRDVIRGPLNVLGVDGYEDSGVIVKMYVETTPGRQWDVGRELMGRITRALEEEGISISAGSR